jgi:uncharacterized protein (TIGR03118 family)
MGGRKFTARPRGLAATVPLVALSLQLAVSPAGHAQGGAYRQTPLVSDIPGRAPVTDPKLVNPWGISSGPTTPFWVSDNGTGVTTLYTGAGQRLPVVVTIPLPRGGEPPSAPTGQVFNFTSDFVVTEGTKSGVSRFIFATEDGTISGWSPGVNPTKAIRTVDNSASGAVYKGLALGSNASGNFLYAANFHDGRIDVFDKHFSPASLAGSFTDPAIPAGFAPFNIENIRGNLYVTYAKQKEPDRHDDQAGPGNGFVDVFDTSGHLLRRVASHGTLNSPWGLALAPQDFGEFSDALLVGNFGDGRINAFHVTSGAFLGQFQDANGTPIAISGLWGLRFGNDAAAGPHNTLFFTAGIDEETHGLFGSLVEDEEIEG